MDVKRRLVVPIALVWLLVCVPTAQAGPLDACAQRVIRDWYSGGRVDKVHPLRCYRAAIRALPNDVLEYSNADKDIARALAFARQARADEGAQQVAEPPGTSGRPATEPDAPVTERPSPALVQPKSVQPKSVQPKPLRAPRPTAVTPASRASNGPRQAAAGGEPTEVSAALPYPVIVLAALAATLLAMGAAGWLLSRRR